MLVALFIGNHSRDTLAVRLGWALTRLVQKGEFARVTHCEGILQAYGAGVADIASSSLRDGGVRILPGVHMNPANWLVVDVPPWNELQAEDWFAEHAGEGYDARGALATVLPGHHQSDRWFCNEAVGASVGLREPHLFTPAQFAAICFSLGRDVTAQFFQPTTQ